MGKRKRDVAGAAQASDEDPRKPFQPSPSLEKGVAVQIITGSYERVLHGITASFSATAQAEPCSQPPVQFADTFLFNAHASAIRALALSPIAMSDASRSQKVILASGGTDERVNLYNLSLSAPSASARLPVVPTLAGNTIIESSKNRELGSLLHHTSSITALYFPTRSKLLSAAEDNTITIMRTRDWTSVSTIKVPRPKIQGRPSGDTAPFDGAPTGINDFALHPSMKLMVSVGKGEKCMRLWNLVTGRKAGVLNFGKEILQGVGEGRWGSGEGKKIRWSKKGDQYAVLFEKGAVVFGMDSKPICRLFPNPWTKLHQICYLSNYVSVDDDYDLVAVSTEDGRVLFYSTTELVEPQTNGSSIPDAVAKVQIGNRAVGGGGRIKDFQILGLPGIEEPKSEFLIITGSSSGSITIWISSVDELRGSSTIATNDTGPTKTGHSVYFPRQVGRVLGTYETGNRITCLVSFVMTEPDEDDDDSFEDFEDGEGAASDDESSEGE